MPEMQISTQVMRDAASKIRTINTSMDSKLQDINKAMNDLEKDWKSDGATEIRAAMNALNPRFEQYKNVIESYAKYLVDTAQQYETTEGTIQNNASAFKK